MGFPMALPMKAQKAKKATKAMKAMKAKRVTKVAKGRFAKSLVLRGKKEKTVGGLTTNDLMRNKRGKVVSKRKSVLGRRAFQRIEGWVEAHMAARRSRFMASSQSMGGRVRA